MLTLFFIYSKQYIKQYLKVGFIVFPIDVCVFSYRNNTNVKCKVEFLIKNIIYL